VITKFCSERVAKYAFEYAYLNNRKTVTAVHKANIMKLADGLFLESCREVAKKYPGIKYNEIIVDNCSMQLVSKPEQFDVMVCESVNLMFLIYTLSGLFIINFILLESESVAYFLLPSLLFEVDFFFPPCVLCGASPIFAIHSQSSLFLMNSYFCHSGRLRPGLCFL